MGASDTRAIVVREAIMRLAGAGLQPHELLRQVARRVRSVVPYAGAGWLLTDPATMVLTGAVTEDVPEDLQLALIDNELVTSDFGKFTEIARLRRPVLRLSEATGGRPERSARFRALYAPAGYGHELRVAFRADGACWAVCCLARRREQAPFSDAEVAFLADLSEPVAVGVRTALRTRTRVGVPSAATDAGMLVLDAAGEIESMTGAAARWLDELPDDGLRVPGVVREVARRAHADQSGRGRLRARARVCARTNRWLLVHGAVLRGAAGEPARAAVILEPAGSAELAPLIVALYGLTEREREVTALLGRGLTIANIGRTLSISHHTVRDHIKAIFAKLRVNSRAELTAKLFYEHVIPAPAASAGGTPASTPRRAGRRRCP
ncbi:MAG TPA: LuxR C-terminal-related transcriptional regulator [Solirubrobacteraceae bacterium]|nr:LuxR C-terminal-related transcriptional regulator [Solirubrobacteraceae bacterium]